MEKDKEIKRKRRKALSPEERQRQLISLAYDAAEQKLKDGTAGPGIITQLLKMGTKREELELERLKTDNQLAKAKAEDIESRKKSEELYKEAIASFKRYNGAYEEDD